MVHTTSLIETIPVEFFVNCKTFFGQNVYICGNCPQLGNWNPSSGIKLETNRKKYPEWYTPHPLIIKSNCLIQFKVCIIKDRIVTWQGIQQNHYFFTGVKPVQIYSNFNNRYIQVFQKKVHEIECRTGIEKVIQDYESQWGSSIGHSSNYPLNNFYKPKKIEQNRSQISSNLISITDSQQIQFQQKILNYFNAGSLLRAIKKPFQSRRRLSAKKQTEKKKNLYRNPQSTELVNQSSKRRSYRSLPKCHQSQPQNIPQTDSNQNENSYPIIGQRVLVEETKKQSFQNNRNRFGDKNINQKKETINYERIKFFLQQRAEIQDSQEDVDDLFGLQIF